MESSSADRDEPLRDRLVTAVLHFLGGRDLIPVGTIRAALHAEIEAAQPHALAELAERLTLDRGWDYYPPDPLARRIHHYLARQFLDPQSHLAAAEHLASVEDKRIVFVSNHLSYADANVLEVLLWQSGFAPLADRLTALAGPKVFTSRERRFSSLCFGTIKVPQSTDVASGEAAMPAREVARAARQAIEVARSRVERGDALILFGEGTRSRTATMQPMLPAVARYLDVEDTWIVPVGLVGSESLFPIDGATVRPARVSATIGRPFLATALEECADRDHRSLIDVVGVAIAELLPSSYRGRYGGTGWEWARAALEAARSTSAGFPAQNGHHEP